RDPRSPSDSAPNSAFPTSPASVPANTHSAFAIGDDEDDDESYPATLVNASNNHSANSSRAGSVGSAADPTILLQLRGMSEKARGKRPAGQSAFSRQSSTTSLGGMISSGSLVTPGAFNPTVEWVCCDEQLPFF